MTTIQDSRFPEFHSILHRHTTVTSGRPSYGRLDIWDSELDRTSISLLNQTTFPSPLVLMTTIFGITAVCVDTVTHGGVCDVTPPHASDSFCCSSQTQKDNQKKQRQHQASHNRQQGFSLEKFLVQLEFLGSKRGMLSSWIILFSHRFAKPAG